jgi:RND family efflux transporter MFP subunit
MKLPTISLFLAIVASFLLASITACNSGGEKPKKGALGRASAQAATATRGNIAHTLSLAGQFQAYQVVDVHPKVTGFMVKINVDIGDRVHKGQTLAVLEVPELSAQLKGAGFEVQRAKDDLLRTQHEVKRAEATYAAIHSDYQRLLETSKEQPGLIAQQELDDAQGKDLSAQAQVDAAKAGAAAAQEHEQVAHSDNDRVQALENYTNVVAPLDGVIVWRYADTGALIQSGTNSNEQDLPIVKLSQSGLLRLRMPIPENDVQFVRIGDPMQVRVDAIGRSFTGKVVRFTREVNFETRTMETEIDVPNQDLSIAPGMYANTQLQLAQAINVVTIPVEALVLRGNQQTVYLLDAANRIQIRNVVVGLEGSRLAEIKSGLSPGDRVILGGQEKYSEGEQVDPILTSSPVSDTVHESGGVIDTKADEEAAKENNGGAH